MKKILLFAAAALALAACGRKAPLVGISCSQYDWQYNLLRVTYTGAIAKAGGIPVILPTVSSDEQAEQLLSKLDGIVFSGGEDVSPAWYGESVLNATVEVDTLRDVSDSLLVRAAVRSGKPILAICRGSQLLNVLLGGSLYQDIPSQLPDNIGHGGATHRIGLVSDGFLAKLFGPDSLTVNSFHHQAVKDQAPGIKIAAYAPDGIVEAWETPQVTAVQFHPEAMLAEGDTLWLKLFSSWVESL